MSEALKDENEGTGWPSELSAGLGSTEPAYTVTISYGHCEIRSWVEFDGENLIGMGSKKTYDYNGKLTDYSESPTGLKITMPNAGVTGAALAKHPC